MEEISMNYAMLAFGIALLITAIIDLAYTTLTPTGAGFLTSIISRFVWKVFYLISGKDGSKKILNIAGMVTMVSILLTWLFMIWFGNTLIFSFDPRSIVHSETKTYASFLEKFYFTGYTLSTMGYGDFVPSSNFWKVYSSVISFTGLILLSIGISYLLPVLSADIQKRKLSIYIASMGNSTRDILLNAWNGKDFKNLNNHIIGLVDSVLEHSQNHLAYPVLHFFHSSSKNENAAVTLCSLDEALSILLIYIPENIRPKDYDLIMLRKAITQYLTTLSSAFISEADDTPPLPDLSEFKKRNIQINENAAYTNKKYNNLVKRRRLLLGLIEEDGWDWHSRDNSYYDHELMMD